MSAKSQAFALAGKVALVTGASRGLGKACALGLAEAGADVVAVARCLPDLDQCVREVEALGRQAIAIGADLTKVDQIRATTRRALQRFGRVDILVNSAGMNVPQYAVDVTEEAWDRVIETNLKGAFFCAQSIGGVMIAQGHGRIVNMASQMSAVGGTRRAAYCSSKAGLVGLTKVLAVEWARHNVLVNAVAPTFVPTPLTESWLADPAIYDDVLRQIPLGRLGTPEDVVGAVLYLASDASNLVTGHTLYVDGGWTAW